MSRWPWCIALLGASGCAEPERAQPRSTAQAVTVDEAVSAGCSTTLVKGLSEQIIAQSNCLAPGAFSPLPARPNLVLGGAVNPYLEEPARDAFVAALDAHPGTQMTVNSMLRTVAQQYLLYEWYLAGTCGIGLAATPGNSNHETGLAVDVDGYQTWKPHLEAVGFQWLGASDVVHFDYVGPGAVDHQGLDVLAFQMLWNLNHPEDPIAEDGDYGPQTAARLAAAPADGFAIPPSCEAPPPTPSLSLHATALDATDALADGASLGVVDLVLGDTYTVAFDLSASGTGGDLGPVRVRALAEDGALAVSGWRVETDLGHPGVFSEDAATADPANPPAGPLGASADLALGALAPGETKRVRLSVDAAAYSVAAEPPPRLRLFALEVAGHYEQGAWGGPTVGDGEGLWGRLEAELPADVYALDRFEWETDRLEGWAPNAVDALVSRAAGPPGALRVDGAAVREGTRFPAAAGVRLRARRVSGAGELRLLFATDASPALGPERAVALELPADGAFHELDVGPASHPDWSGTITTLALAGGSFEVDWIHAGADGGGEVPGASAACACRSAPSSPRAGWAAAAAALAFAVRRRHRRTGARG